MWAGELHCGVACLRDIKGYGEIPRGVIRLVLEMVSTTKEHNEQGFFFLFFFLKLRLGGYVQTQRWSLDWSDVGLGWVTHQSVSKPNRDETRPEAGRKKKNAQPRTVPHYSSVVGPSGDWRGC